MRAEETIVEIPLPGFPGVLEVSRITGTVPGGHDVAISIEARYLVRDDHGEIDYDKCGVPVEIDIPLTPTRKETTMPQLMLVLQHKADGSVQPASPGYGLKEVYEMIDHRQRWSHEHGEPVDYWFSVWKQDFNGDWVQDCTVNKPPAEQEGVPC